MDGLEEGQNGPAGGRLRSAKGEVADFAGLWAFLAIVSAFAEGVNFTESQSAARSLGSARLRVTTPTPFSASALCPLPSRSALFFFV
ncbi:hypothetical protein AXG93_857s1190 [Marchantia polymorpha subsp. ruderalis]|uniref:Uncharacterized protein n=1 Tax=Marchantia polymorpha subsp. ruderalis TaxID=1480154 RepID=A0A176WFA6_MARPO|nr:hypothetical protein AXG93_857s1190 [Marchantia polymorpha subsp. ruderalis]